MERKRGVKMKRDMASVEFEYRSEVQELIKVIGKYIEAYPEEKDNATIKELYGMLDVMDMEW